MGSRSDPETGGHRRVKRDNVERIQRWAANPIQVRYRTALRPGLRVRNVTLGAEG